MYQLMQLKGEDASMQGLSSPALPRVISEFKTAELCSLSIATVRRKRKDGTGPKHVQLSTRRVGYRVSDIEVWLTERAE
jgi:predicted DNA-binding transcriptional regulator AlpA